MPFIALGQTSCDCGQESILDAGSGYVSYSWSSGETSQTINIDPSCPTDSQTYSVTVTDACGNTAINTESLSICTSSQITINTAFFTGSAQICLLFGNTPSCCENPIYEWIDPCGSIVSMTRFLNATDITVCGFYTINLISCNGCTECSSSASINIQTGQSNNPDCCGGSCGCTSCPANITSFASTATCNNATSYSATSCTGATLSWNASLAGSTVASGTGSNFSFTTTIDGTYTVTLTVLDDCGITTTDSVTTIVSDCGTGCQDCTSSMITTNNTPSCGVPTVFSVSCSNTSSFTWSITGGGGIPSGNQLTYTPTSSGTYTVTVLFIDECGNQITDTFTFSVTCTTCDCNVNLFYDEPNCEWDYTVTGCDSWQLRKGINAACNGVTTVASGTGNAIGSYDICNGQGDGFYNLVGLESGCPFQISSCMESDCCCPENPLIFANIDGTFEDCLSVAEDDINNGIVTCANWLQTGTPDTWLTPVLSTSVLAASCPASPDGGVFAAGIGNVAGGETIYQVFDVCPNSQYTLSFYQVFAGRDTNATSVGDLGAWQISNNGSLSQSTYIQFDGFGSQTWHSFTTTISTDGTGILDLRFASLSNPTFPFSAYMGIDGITLTEL